MRMIARIRCGSRLLASENLRRRPDTNRMLSPVLLLKLLIFLALPRVLQYAFYNNVLQ